RSVLVLVAACGRVGFDPMGGDDGGVVALQCPTNYLPTAPVAGFATQPFCVAKYEMKSVSGAASSTPDHLPWTNISRDEAVTASQALGASCDWATNAQWQTIACTWPASARTGAPGRPTSARSRWAT